jgi:hypothetical protein
MLAVGLIITELLGKGRPRRRVDSRPVAIRESGMLIGQTGEYIPPPGDDRPLK